ncbi:MAG: FecR domain-containing protein [Planctomycetota bacterium]
MNDALRDELSGLIAAASERQLDGAGFDRLGALIKADTASACLCVERLDLQAALVDFATQDEPEAVVDRALSRNTVTRSRRRLWSAVASVAAAVVVCAVVVLSAGVVDTRAPVVATVRSVSEAAVVAADGFASGKLMRVGERLKVAAGVVTLRSTAGASIDVRGPATLHWIGRERLQLISGSVRAFVPPEAVGFTVRTERAEVVDLGTEFVVEHRIADETRVGVRRGRVDVYLLDADGDRERVAPLVAGESATLTVAGDLTEGFTDEAFDWYDRRVGRLRGLSGAATISENPLADLRSGGTPTPDHVLVVPEWREVMLTEPLTVVGHDGPRTLPAGRSVDSYLLHYDPQGTAGRAPVGTATFGGRIAALLTTAAERAATDRTFGLPEVVYGDEAAGSLEASDRVAIADDGRTVRFDFGIDPNQTVRLDQVRVIVFSHEG